MKKLTVVLTIMVTLLFTISCSSNTEADSSAGYNFLGIQSNDSIQDVENKIGKLQKGKYLDSDYTKICRVIPRQLDMERYMSLMSTYSSGPLESDGKIVNGMYVINYDLNTKVYLNLYLDPNSKKMFGYNVVIPTDEFGTTGEDILKTLKDKYGEPSVVVAKLNSYVWKNSDMTLYFQINNKSECYQRFVFDKTIDSHFETFKKLKLEKKVKRCRGEYKNL